MLEAMLITMFLFLLIGMLLAPIAAGVAAKKGRHFGRWITYGVFFAPIALIHCAAIKKNEALISARKTRGLGLTSAGEPNENGLVLEAVRPWRIYMGMFFFWFLIFPPIVAIIQKKSVLLQVYSDRIILQEGILSRNMREIFVSELRTVDYSQGAMERFLDVGTLRLATAGTNEFEISVQSLEYPHDLMQVIMDQKKRYMAPPPASAFLRESTS